MLFFSQLNRLFTSRYFIGWSRSPLQIETFWKFTPFYWRSPIFIDKKIVGYNKQKSTHPLFKGKPKGFEHICTRKSKHSGKRNFDPERTNKIHWIKPIINHRINNRIKYFERLHYKGENQWYFWHEDKNYVVVIREITENLQLVTAFKVDDIEQNRFKKWYNEYKTA